jgi:hypothetical protein
VGTNSKQTPVLPHDGRPARRLVDQHGQDAQIDRLGVDTWPQRRAFHSSTLIEAAQFVGTLVEQSRRNFQPGT